jgi:hypothetical protein
MTVLEGIGTGDPVWYVAYGSNLSAERFRAYLQGGRPQGSARIYAGCRDRSLPRAAGSTWLPGRLCFTGRSTVWGGGLAVYDPEAPGEVAARSYLVTFGQLSDVIAQEARRPVGRDLVRLPDGRLQALSAVYDAIVELETRDGLPALTMTSTAGHAPAAPSAAYLTTILGGLADGFDLDDEARVDYLLRAEGVRPTWTADDLRALRDLAPPQVIA